MDRKKVYTCEDMINHGSYTHNLNSCDIKAWKKFRPELYPIQAWILFQALISQLFKLCV